MVRAISLGAAGLCGACTLDDYNDVGDGSASNPYQIWNEAQLNDIGADACGASASADCGAHFVLKADIDLSGVSYNMIGSSSNKFSGTFDGEFNVIENLTIAASGSNNVGLFGYVILADIHDLALVGADVSGNNYVGAMIGYANDATISNCSVDESAVEANAYAGGMVGYLNQGLLEDSDAEVYVATTNNIAGGLIGITALSEVTTSYAVGQVHAGGDVAGGFVGLNGSVLSHNEYFGSTITDCYAWGDVTGGDSVGGFAGTNNHSSIANSYAIGVPTGTGSVGGFLGSDVDNSGFTANFWDRTTSGIVASSGFPGITGRSTADMQDQSTFDPPWDFTTVWKLNPGDYPEHR